VSPLHTPRMSKLGSGCATSSQTRTSHSPSCKAHSYTHEAKKASARCWTPPPGPRRRSAPALLRAIRACSEQAVSAALEEDPCSSTDLFWDHDCDTPLCAAIRNRCSAGIVRLLLARGASPTAADSRGWTPLTLLSAQRGWDDGLAVADLLVRSGCSPETQDLGGRRPLDLAAAADNLPFIRYVSDLQLHYLDVARRGARAAPLAELPDAVLDIVKDCLASTKALVQNQLPNVAKPEPTLPVLPWRTQALCL